MANFVDFLKSEIGLGPDPHPSVASGREPDVSSPQPFMDDFSTVLPPRANLEQLYLNRETPDTRSLACRLARYVLSVPDWEGDDSVQPPRRAHESDLEELHTRYVRLLKVPFLATILPVVTRDSSGEKSLKNATEATIFSFEVR